MRYFFKPFAHMLVGCEENFFLHFLSPSPLQSDKNGLKNDKNMHKFDVPKPGPQCTNFASLATSRYFLVHYFLRSSFWQHLICTPLKFSKNYEVWKFRATALLFKHSFYMFEKRHQFLTLY